MRLVMLERVEFSMSSITLSYRAIFIFIRVLVVQRLIH